MAAIPLLLFSLAPPRLRRHHSAAQDGLSARHSAARLQGLALDRHQLWRGAHADPASPDARHRQARRRASRFWLVVDHLAATGLSHSAG